MELWQWIAVGLAVWLLFSVALAGLWAAIGLRLRTRHRGLRRRRTD